MGLMEFQPEETYPLSITRAATSSVQAHSNQYTDSGAPDEEAEIWRCPSLQRIGQLTLHGGDCSVSGEL